MHLLVAGADGRVGRQVTDQAIGHGHTVSRLEGSRDRVRLTDDVRRAEAVISTLALDGTGSAELPQDVTADLVRTMVREGVGRLVVASLAGAGSHQTELPLLQQVRIALPSARQRLSVAETIEGEVMVSDLDWTIVRAASPSDKERTGHYRVVEGPVVPRGTPIPRGDLAAFLLKIAETDRYPRRIVSVAG